MFDLSLLSMIPVEYEHQMLEVFNCINRDMVFTGTAMDSKLDVVAFEHYITDHKLFFTNVYYDSQLIGYIIIEQMTMSTVIFHWGVCNKHKYIPRMITECFNKCKELKYENFIGYINVTNKLSKKIAERMGFKYCYTISKYCDDGNDALVMIYNQGENNG